MLVGVLSDVRATPDWQRIAAEYDAGEPLSTPLGRADREFWDRRHARPA